MKISLCWCPNHRIFVAAKVPGFWSVFLGHFRPIREGCKEAAGRFLASSVPVLRSRCPRSRRSTLSSLLYIRPRRHHPQVVPGLGFEFCWKILNKILSLESYYYTVMFWKFMMFKNSIAINKLIIKQLQVNLGIKLLLMLSLVNDIVCNFVVK